MNSYQKPNVGQFGPSSQEGIDLSGENKPFFLNYSVWKPESWGYSMGVVKSHLTSPTTLYDIRYEGGGEGMAQSPLCYSPQVVVEL